MASALRLLTLTLVTVIALQYFIITANANERVIYCYWGTWAHYRSGNGKFQVSNIDPNLCTHLSYTFFGISDDGTFRSLDSWLDFDLNNIQNTIALKQRNPQLKVLAAVGGWNEGSAKYSSMAADPGKRNRFITSTMQFLQQYHFDGLDLDWEYPGQRGGQPADMQNFITLLHELKAAMNQHNMILAAAVAATEPSAGISYNIAQVAQYVDLINVMTYDFFGPWEQDLGFNSALRGSGPNTVQASIEYWLRQGAPSSKLLLGVPLYGHTFTLADWSRTQPGDPAAGAGTAGPFTQTAGFLGYHEMCEKFREGGWTQVWDDAHVVPYAFKGNQWYSYDNEQSIVEKMNFLKANNLRGAILWSIETDDFNGICGESNPLMKAVKRNIY